MVSSLPVGSRSLDRHQIGFTANSFLTKFCGLGLPGWVCHAWPGIPTEGEVKLHKSRIKVREPLQIQHQLRGGVRRQAKMLKAAQQAPGAVTLTLLWCPVITFSPDSRSPVLVAHYRQPLPTKSHGSELQGVTAEARRNVPSLQQP